MILDNEGNPLKTEKSQAQVMEELEKLAPKNEEEEAILAREISSAMESYRKKKIVKDVDTGYDGLFAQNKAKRINSDGFTDERGYRQIAEVPLEIDRIAQELYGPEYYKDPKILKKALLEDEVGRMCLTVDPKTI